MPFNLGDFCVVLTFFIFGVSRPRQSIEEALLIDIVCFGFLGGSSPPKSDWSYGQRVKFENMTGIRSDRDEKGSGLIGYDI